MDDIKKCRTHAGLFHSPHTTALQRLDIPAPRRQPDWLRQSGTFHPQNPRPPWVELAQREQLARANGLGIDVNCVLSEVFMGHNKGKDNVKKRAVRRKKNDRIQAAKDAAKAPVS